MGSSKAKEPLMKKTFIYLLNLGSLESRHELSLQKPSHKNDRNEIKVTKLKNPLICLNKCF